MRDSYKVIEDHLVSMKVLLYKMDKKMDRMAKVKDCFEGDELLDNQDLCLLLGVTKKTLYRYRKKGILKSYTMDDRKVYYKKSEIPQSLTDRK